MTLIFIYGTLKRGHVNAHYMAPARYVGEAVTADPLFQMVAMDYKEYPYPSLKPGNHYIAGEIYEVEPDFLGFLDDFERAGIEYERREIALDTVSKVHTYLWLAGNTMNYFESHAKIHYDPESNQQKWIL